jgi:hypothetical protein
VGFGVTGTNQRLEMDKPQGQFPNNAGTSINRSTSFLSPDRIEYLILLCKITSEFFSSTVFLFPSMRLLYKLIATFTIAGCGGYKFKRHLIGEALAETPEQEPPVMFRGFRTTSASAKH